MYACPGRPPLHEQDIAPYAPDVPNQQMNLSWLQWFSYAMVWVRALPPLWSGRPAVGRSRAENVRDTRLPVPSSSNNAMQYIKMIKSKQIHSKIAVVGYVIIYEDVQFSYTAPLFM